MTQDGSKEQNELRDAFCFLTAWMTAGKLRNNMDAMEYNHVDLALNPSTPLLLQEDSTRTFGSIDHRIQLAQPKLR